MMESRPSKNFYVPIVKALITLLLLWGVGAILKELPMLEGLTIGEIALSASAIVEMVIALLMVGVLINFARDFGHQMRRALPRFPQGSVVIASLVYIIAIVIVYNAFSPLGRVLFKRDFWIYQVGFLALVLLPLWIGGATLYRNTDKLVNLITMEVDKAAEEITQIGRYTETVTCSNCSASNAPDAEFCVVCDAELDYSKEEQQSVTCSACGAVNKPTARFCFQCGASLAPPVEEETSSKACPACGSTNDSDASFCIECGADLSSS
jgi:ribosomal protein L40E